MYEYRCKIVRVVDGDTVDVDIDLGFGIWLTDERVRLHGIDAPESRTRDKVEKKFGLLAKEFVQKTLPKGSIQTLVTEKAGDESKGKFGRVLGKFKVYDAESDSWSFLSKIMIEQGYAVKYNGENKALMEKRHLENRRKLIENNRIDMTLEEAGL